MIDLFQIYIQRLASGKSEEIDQVVKTKSFLDLSEADLQFPEEMRVVGKAYLADEHLILQLKLDTSAIMPCSICNEKVEIAVENNNVYSAIPLDEIKSDVYDFSSQVREAILLEIPQFIECPGGCVERSSIAKYFVEGKQETYHPFAGLELEEPKE